MILVQNTSTLATYEGARPENLAILALDDPRLNDQLDSNPLVDISPSSLAYLIWTSGTTGLPKVSESLRVTPSHAYSTC